MVWYFLLGVSTGMRTMTAIAVLCWAAYLGKIPQHGWAAWTTYLVSAIVFTLCALGEYVGDTLARTPSRKSAFPAAARVIFGALVGALAASALEEPIAGGIIFAVMGALVGTWGGFAARKRCAGFCGRDLPVALGESALALVLALWSAHAIHHGVLSDLKYLTN